MTAREGQTWRAKSGTWELWSNSRHLIGVVQFHSVKREWSACAFRAPPNKVGAWLGWFATRELAQSAVEDRHNA